MADTPTTVFEMVSDSITDMKAVADAAVTQMQAAMTAIADYMKVDLPYIDAPSSTFTPEEVTVSAEKPSPIMDTVKDLLNLTDSMPSAPDGADKTIDWSEAAYTSTLKTIAEALVLTYLQGGGTAIDSTVEDAIWRRQSERDDIAMFDEINDELGAMGALGYSLPQGVDVAMIDGKMVKNSLQRQDRSRQIAEKVADLEQDQRKFSVTAATNIETMNIQEKSARMQRALDAAKYLPDLVVRIFEAEVSKFKALADVMLGKVQALVSSYNADVQAYQVEGNISGKNADLQIEEAKLIEMNTENNLRLALETSTRNLQTALQQWNIGVEAEKGIAQILAGIGSAAMQAIHTSASLGASSGHSVGYSYGGKVKSDLTSTGDAAVTPSI